MRSGHVDDHFFEAVGSTASRSSGGPSGRTVSGGRIGGASARTSSSSRPGEFSSSQSSGEFDLGSLTSAIGKIGSYAQLAGSLAGTASKAFGSRAGGSSSSGSSGGFDFGSVTSAIGKVTSYAQQAWDFAQAGVKGYQAAQQFAASLGLGGRGPAGVQTAPPAPFSAPAYAPRPGVQPERPQAGPPPPMPGSPVPTYAAGTVSQPQPSGAIGGLDQIAALLQALQQRQIPSLPGFAPAAPAPAPLTNAFGTLRTILTNPQLQQTLRAAPAVGAAVSRAVQLPVPNASAPQQLRNVEIPLNAVLAAVTSLAGKSTAELAGTEGDEQVPAYLVGDDGGYLVDPANAAGRAALAAYLFRLNDAARRSGWYPQLDGPADAGDFDMDDSDAWARAAGFP